MSTRYEETGSPGPLPVLLEEVKAYLKIDTDADDAVITLLIEAATQFAERYTGRDLRTRTWVATLDRFTETHTDRIELRRNQIKAISSVKYWNDADTPVDTTVDAGDYYLVKGQWWAFAVLKASACWPTDVDDEQKEQRIRVTFTTVLPVAIEAIKVALLRILAQMHERRGDCDSPEKAAALASAVAGPFLGTFRIPRI